MFKLMDKKIMAISRKLFLLNWLYAVNTTLYICLFNFLCDKTFMSKQPFFHFVLGSPTVVSDCPILVYDSVTWCNQYDRIRSHGLTYSLTSPVTPTETAESLIRDCLAKFYFCSECNPDLTCERA